MAKKENICPGCGKTVEGEMERTSARQWAEVEAKQLWNTQAKGVGVISDIIIPGSSIVTETLASGRKFGVDIGPMAEERKKFIENYIDETCPNGRCYFTCQSCGSKWIQWYDKNRNIVPYEYIERQRIYWLEALQENLGKKRLPAILATVVASIFLIVFLFSEKTVTVQKSFLFYEYSNEEFTTQALMSLTGFFISGIIAAILFYKYSKAKRDFNLLSHMSFEQYIASKYCQF